MEIVLKKYEPFYREQIVTLWEESVRATHHFLSVSDIGFYKTLVEKIDFNDFAVFLAFSESELAGFLGVANNKLEMLFLKPAFIGKGLGRRMLEFSIRELRAEAVDVNEGNIQAVGFYSRFGFRVYDRSPVDDFGKPYPVLKMRLDTEDEKTKVRGVTG